MCGDVAVYFYKIVTCITDTPGLLVLKNKGTPRDIELAFTHAYGLGA